MIFKIGTFKGADSRIAKNRYIAGVKAPQEDYHSTREITEPGKAEILLSPSDFITRDKPPMPDWSNITTFTFEIYDGAAKQTARPLARRPRRNHQARVGHRVAAPPYLKPGHGWRSACRLRGSGRRFGMGKMGWR